MAESILYRVVANILTQLGTPAVKQLGLIRGVNDELLKLRNTLFAIQAVLVDAEEKMVGDNRVKDWVSKLKDVVYQIEDLMDERAYDALRTQVLAKDRRNKKQVRMLFSKFKRPYSNLKLAHKIKEIREKLKAINEDKTQFSFSERVLDAASDEFKKKRETCSFIPEEEVIGRNNDKEEIIELLLNTNFEKDIAIISIVGMGGLGKTTLTQSVYNDDMIAKKFELKFWVCVSEDFDVKIIVKNIIESSDSIKSLDSLANELKRKIDGKKYLLVMDDVWNVDYEKWVTLKRLLMGGAKGSRILITTRDEKVARTQDTTTPFIHYLQKLDEPNSWSLFKKMAFLEEEGEESENSELVKIGKQIVAKLRGVPLAIRTIGRLLNEKKSQKFWSSFKDNELYHVMEQVKNNDLDYMLSILELSYKHLSANLKQCFLYCALFPKDYEIEKDELILLWKAQGFVPPNDKDELIDIGEDYFLELLSKSFFQDVRKDGLRNIETCKMHDLMHDLACTITKSQCIHGLKNIDERTHHLSSSSLSREESKELTKTLSKARNLRTFYMPRNCSKGWELDFAKFFEDHLQLRTLMSYRLDQNAKYFKSIIGRFKHLRYLKFGNLSFKELPNCITELYNLEILVLQYSPLVNLPSDIKNLINLKHLDLSRNENLEFLPNSICELLKLEVVILTWCRNLKILPGDVKNWIKLRHLDLGGSGMKFLPDSITQLVNLETLLLYGCSDIKELPKDIKRLINLKHLLVSPYLTHMPKGLGELTNLQTLNEFVLGENNGAELSELEGLSKLKGHLRIRNLQFCSDVDLQMKPKLLHLKSGLQGLELKWKNLSDERVSDCLLPHSKNSSDERVLDCLQPHSNFKDISIRGYGGVKLCNWLSFGVLGRLVSIHLYECIKLQHLPQFDQFPHLKRLGLRDLPNMEYIVDNDYVSSSTIFPSLEYLEIIDMPKLKRWWKGTTTSTESTEPPTSWETSFSITFPRLSELWITNCHLRILMSWHAPLLKKLKIGNSMEGYGIGIGVDIEEDEFDVVPWENFENLSYVDFSNLYKLEYLPKRLENVSTLQRLSLWKCENLKSLPEWIHNLTSLTELEIYVCEKLISMPEGIRHLHGLLSLRISECPILEERCKKYTGEDWPKIAHIPKVVLSCLLQ